MGCPQHFESHPDSVGVGFPNILIFQTLQDLPFLFPHSEGLESRVVARFLTPFWDAWYYISSVYKYCVTICLQGPQAKVRFI